jgi:hypothetical protein
MWVYITTLPTSGNERQWLGQNDNWTTAWYLSVYNDAGTYYLNFAINGSNIIARTIALSTDTWTHIAVVRSGNSWYEFKDGTQLGGVATNSSSVPDVNSALVFGTGWNDAIVGYIDEPRIVVGSAEWTASFTPLTSEYSFLLTGVSYMES